MPRPLPAASVATVATTGPSSHGICTITRPRRALSQLSTTRVWMMRVP